MSRVLVIALVVCAGITMVNAACGIDSIDLTSMTRDTDYTGQDQSTPPYVYDMNVCGKSKSCDASICQKADRYYTLGTYDAATTWAYLDAGDKTKGIKASFTNGEGCWLGSMQTRYVNVEFPCAATDATTFTAVESPKCTFTLSLPTTKSCGGSKPPGPTPDVKVTVGISGGWVFIIILLVVIPIYIVVGCIYKTKKLGTSGKESCPNWDFWSSIPGLVKDGVKFTFRGCKKGATYNQL